MSLCVVFVTSREKCEFGWFADSLRNEGNSVEQIIVVDFYADQDERRTSFRAMARREITHVQPKPTVWAGKHRLTTKDYWAKSNALNTAICLCKCDTIAFVDDRSVLMPGWLKSVNEATFGDYAVFGAYQKRTGMTVENGVIKHGGIITGEDARDDYVVKHRNGEAPTKCPGEWCFGCTLALPLDWALEVNGFEELMDGLGAEDVIFGLMLQNNGFDTRYDRRMMIVEDRTPSELGTPMFRTSKERYPHDKSDKGHKALERFGTSKRAQHDLHLETLRDRIQAGASWPIKNKPDVDWFDGQFLREM